MEWYETKSFQGLVIGVVVTMAVALGLAVGSSISQPFSSKADSVSTSSTANNELPSASSAAVDGGAGSVTLTENTTTNVVCTATVTDNNGCSDLSSVAYVLYRTNVSGGAGCTPDNDDCYTGSCSIDGGSCTGGVDLTSTVTCTVPVQHFADPTDAGPHSGTNWTCAITPTDGDGAGTADSDAIEIDTLAAFDVTASIAYGALDLGTNTGASNQTTTFTNTGNVQLDIEFSGTDMSCGIGTVAAANQQYDTSDVTYSSLSYALSNSSTERDVDLAKGAASTQDVFWGLAMPASGVDGACSGSNTVTPVSDHNLD